MHRCLGLVSSLYPRQPKRLEFGCGPAENHSLLRLCSGSRPRSHEALAAHYCEKVAFLNQSQQGTSKSNTQGIRLEFFKYLSIGAVAFGLDVLVFNGLSILRINAILEISPYVAKIFSVSVGMLFSYFANGRWTFRNRTGTPQGVGRFLKYLVVNLIGLALAVLPLFVSREILGLDSLLADNISANIVGAGLGFVFRFLANRQWVFTSDTKETRFK